MSTSCPDCRPEDTLYLELSGVVVRPGLLVVSDHGRMNVDFERVGTGECVMLSYEKRIVTLSSISLSLPAQVTRWSRS